MMDLLLATSGCEAQAAGGGYVDDVFSAYTYTGNGSTQTINNGIDLAGKGGLVWIKQRNATISHALADTARGFKSVLWSDTTGAQTTFSESTRSVTSTGFTVNTDSFENGSSSSTFVSWTFRRAPKFFDVVTYTGDGVVGRQIAHGLGVAPGMVIVKNTTEAASWKVWHRTLALNNGLVLNSPNAIEGQQYWLYNTAPTDSLITIGNAGSDAIESNKVGNTYVAYLFAHDPSAEGIVQCGSFTTDASGNATVNLGWEPQYLLYKCASSTSDWAVVDVARGWNNSDIKRLYPNTSNTESSYTLNPPNAPTSTGFTFNSMLQAGAQFIYLAIRRPNKPPTSGADVYNAIARTGTGAAATVTGVGFAPDMAITKKRSSTTLTGARFVDRLRGATRWLDSSATTAETATADTVTGLDNMNGFVLGADATTSAFNTNTHTYIDHFLKRAKGFFDVVCDSGTGVAHGITHGLSVAPEFIIRKSRSGATQWECWHSALAATEKLVLNSIAAKATDATAWNSTLPTPTQFTVGTGANVNTNAATYVTYLFATLAGISKVGSYTGNGTSQTINCGFATGARFILIKRTDAAGDWYVWDSVRGIIAANDPHLSLNTTAAEVTTDDSVDPEASGFIVNQNTATNINVNGGQYIFLAIA